MTETAINDNPRRAVIATAQMVQDARLARLFAHVGELVWAWDEGIDEDHAVQALADDLMALAPEFLPPSEDAELEAAWRGLIEGATS